MDNLFAVPEFAGPSDDPELFEPVRSGTKLRLEGMIPPI